MISNEQRKEQFNKAIQTLLGKNERITLASIGRTLGISANTAKYRFKELLAENEMFFKDLEGKKDGVFFHTHARHLKEFNKAIEHLEQSNQEFSYSNIGRYFNISKQAAHAKYFKFDDLLNEKLRITKELSKETEESRFFDCFARVKIKGLKMNWRNLANEYNSLCSTNLTNQAMRARFTDYVEWVNKENDAYYMNEAKKLLSEKGGKFLSLSYEGQDNKHDFQCQHGHVWSAKFHNVIGNGSWCPECRKKSMSIRMKKQ